MPDLVQFGTLPEWLSLLPATAVTVHGIVHRRDHSARRWAEYFEELVGISPEDLAAFVANHDREAELVADCMVAGARAVDEGKRRLLARVAAAGVLGDEHVPVDDLLLFVRTLEVVDSPHMKVLGIVGAQRVLQAGALSATGGVTTNDIVGSWPAVQSSTDPLLALLSREGLIRDAAVGSWDYQPSWTVTPYGDRFLSFVRTGEPQMLIP